MVLTGGKLRRDLINADMEEEWPYPLLTKEIDARHRAKKIADGNFCSTLPVLIPRTAGWWGIDPRWKPSYINGKRGKLTTEAWSQALNDVVHETRAYDHNSYEQYIAWYSSQTRIRLLAPEDPDERGPPNIEQIYDMQHAPPAHLTTDIAGELVREMKTLWERLTDGIAGTNQEVMAAVDSLRRKAQSERPPHIALRPSPLNSRVGNANGLSRASDTSCKATYDSSNDARCANLTLAMGICTICRSLIDDLFPVINRAYSARRLVLEYRVIWTCCNKMTQPTQPDDGDLQGNIHDPSRSNRECHEPNRLSLSGPRHAAGRRKKTISKRAETSRTMTDHDDE
uniref:Aminotransferase-like plant mobile domain-containing protein n=1 Tax=Oryza punctata TaxID=4537 RepID=A0A0E0JI76_ORYPU